MIGALQRHALVGLGVGLALSLAGLAAQTVRLERERTAHQRTVAAVATERAQASEGAREIERLASASRTRIDHDHQAQIERLARAAAVTRADADGVRDGAAAIAGAARDASAAGCADERRTIEVLAGLVGESGELVAAGKTGAERLVAQATGLRAFVGEVCVAAGR